LTDKYYYAQRLNERLPRVLQGAPNLQKLFEAIGDEMSQLAAGTSLLMRSRWQGLARGWEDPRAEPAKKRNTELGRIGRMFGCLPGIGESAAQFRRRLLDFIRLHRDGLGTAPSLLRLVALVYRADDTPIITWEEEKAVAVFHVRDQKGDSRRLRLELRNNPEKTYVKKCTGVKPDISPESEADPVKLEDAPDDGACLINEGLNPAMPEIELSATYGDVAVPMLIHEETGIHILYIGFIPKGVCLSFDRQLRPLLDHQPRIEFLKRYPRFNTAKFHSSASSARYADSDLEETDMLLTGHGFSYGRARFGSRTYPVAGQARFASFGSMKDFPVMNPGTNRWRYSTLGRQKLRSYLKNIESISDEQKNKLLQHAWEEQTAPKIDIKFAWQTRVPTCFALEIPADFWPPFMEHFEELKQAVERALNYGRAAGVTFQLETYHSNQ
jgi:hypothetical protein